MILVLPRKVSILRQALLVLYDYLHRLGIRPKGCCKALALPQHLLSRLGIHHGAEMGLRMFGECIQQVKYLMIPA